MSTKISHGQMTVVDEQGNLNVLHHETSASDVLVDRTNNTQIPSDVSDLQKLVNKIGSLAFKSAIGSADLNGVIVNNYTTTTEGKALDAVAGKDLNDRLGTIENSNLVVLGETEESEFVIPESEINDTATSTSTTWSSAKIINMINGVETRVEALDVEAAFYIPLVEIADESYTTTAKITDIEEAYRAGKTIWVVASDVFLPLTTRISENEWVFSGYRDTQAFDITVRDTGVTFAYRVLATVEDKLPNPEPLMVKGAVQATYDGTTAIEIEIPDNSEDILNQAKTYTDEEVAKLVNGAPELLDTLGEIAKAIGDLETESGEALEPVLEHVNKKDNPHKVTLTQLGVTASADSLNKVDISESLTTLLEGKATKDHGDHVVFDTTNKPKANGTASVGGTSTKTVAKSDHVHPLQTTVSGNAGSATEFESAQSVTLSGDVSGSASSKAGWTINTTLANSGVSAGSYGPSENASPSHKGTFSVPEITVDAKGRVTSASTRTITLPADTNTDTKVTQYKTTVKSFRPVLLHSLYGDYGNTIADSETGNVYYTENIAVNASTGEFKAKSLSTGSGKMQYNETDECLEFVFA